MIRSVRIFGIPVLTIETTEDSNDAKGDAQSTPVAVGFVAPFTREDQE